MYLVCAYSPVIARLNNGTVQVINPRVHTEWRDYCDGSRQASWKLHRMLLVLCHSLGYDGLQQFNSKLNE